MKRTKIKILQASCGSELRLYQKDKNKGSSIGVSNPAIDNLGKNK